MNENYAKYGNKEEALGMMVWSGCYLNESMDDSDNRRERGLSCCDVASIRGVARMNGDRSNIYSVELEEVGLLHYYTVNTTHIDALWMERNYWKNIATLLQRE